MRANFFFVVVTFFLGTTGLSITRKAVFDNVFANWAYYILLLFSAVIFLICIFMLVGLYGPTPYRLVLRPDNLFHRKRKTLEKNLNKYPEVGEKSIIKFVNRRFNIELLRHYWKAISYNYELNDKKGAYFMRIQRFIKTAIMLNILAYVLKLTIDLLK